VKFPALDADEPPLALSSAEKSVTVQTHTHTHRESPIFVNFAPIEAQNRTNQSAHEPRTPLQYIVRSIYRAMFMFMLTYLFYLLYSCKYI